MKQDAFSIIIPTYNCPDKLRRILDSLKTQLVEFPQTEIIVVDDGGKDDLRWVNEYPGARLYRQRNGGAAKARNKGLDLADTEYIAFLDSDDEIFDNYLRTIYGDMRDGYAWVSYDWLCDGHKEWAKQTDDPLMINCAVWAYCFRADLIGDKRAPEHMVLAEDQAWLHMVLRDDVKHKHSPEIFYNYLWQGNDNSVVHRYLRGELKKTREVKPSVFYRNIFYINNINHIGGVETMFYNMARKYGDTHDITIFYRTGDRNQINRLKQYVRVKQLKDGMSIRCQKIFCNLYTDILSQVEADEVYQIIHADYKAYKIKHVPHPDVSHYIGVSENTCKVFKELSGFDCQLVYNPIVVDKPRKILHLITAARLTWEKGRGRMEQLAKALDDAGIPFVWTVFTDSPERINNPSFVYRPTRLDITDYIADADYLVQLSDTEGWSYSIYESLLLGTPVIVTEFPSAFEMGIENGVNGFILPFSMDNLPLKEICKGVNTNRSCLALPSLCKGVKKFKYEPKQDAWGDILAPGKSTYEEEKNAPVRVKCTKYYFDIELNDYQSPGMEQLVSQERADKLVSLGVSEYME